MTTKIVAVLGVAALGAFASPALAELICGEAVSDGSYASGGGSWSRIVYEVDTRAWVIEHHLPNGQVVFRGDQYDVTDRSDSGRLQWVGTQYQNRRLHMIGEVMSLTATGEPTYNEWLYDDAKRGALVLHTVALCRFEKPAPPPPTAQPSAPALPPPPPAAEAPPRYLPPTTAKPAPNAAVDSVPIYSDRGGRAVRVDVKIGGVFVRMLIDTGATDLVITNSLASTLVAAGDAEWLPNDEAKLADGTKIEERNVKIHRDLNRRPHADRR